MAGGASRRRRGELAIVLHTHMPYVEGGGRWPPDAEAGDWHNREGFGTWPFGEEWLWEAVATSYLPLLDLLDGLEHPCLTLSLTPVLADQLEAPGAMERCLRFLRDVRPESHRLDIAELEAAGDRRAADELKRSAEDYAAAAEALAAGDLLRRLAPHVSWTSSATHAVLPLLATDAGASLQLRTGVASHRRRFTEWQGGLWLPECAYAPWLDEALVSAGVRATCIELAGGIASEIEESRRPLLSPGGLVLWPIDRRLISLVWDRRGYPSGPAYRDYHRRTTHHHRVLRVDGRPYDRRAAQRAAREDARDFVARAGQRVEPGGVCVCALDTELLGHWWYEGVDWLAEVVREAERTGLPLSTLDAALERHDPAPVGELPVSTWGEQGDLSTWSGPSVADLAWGARSAELSTLRTIRRPSDRELRELLALQSSDWAFLAWHGNAGPYPRERAAAHLRALRQAAEGAPLAPGLRNLAPDLRGFPG